MPPPLRPQDIQRLQRAYHLPEQVAAWTKGQAPFNETSEYHLHDKLCNMHPEDALVCITLCAQVISKFLPHNNGTETLQDRLLEILTHYGSNALERLDRPHQPDESCDIQTVAADLTLLSKDLEKSEVFLPTSPDDLHNIIFSALTIQAGAQAEIARYVLTNLWQQESSPTDQANIAGDIPFLKTAPANDNHTRF